MLYTPVLTEQTYAIYARAYTAYVCHIRPCLHSIRTLYKLGLTERTYAVYAQPNINVNG